MSEHKERVITNESDVDEDLCGHIVAESNRFSSSFHAYQSHNDRKGKSKIIFCHKTVSPKVHPKVKSNLFVGDKVLSTKVVYVIVVKPRCKSFRSMISSAVHVGRKCGTSGKFKEHDVIKFTRKAERRLNEKCELLKLGTRGEKSGKSFRYGFKKWPAFLKLNYIDFGSTLFFTYVKSSQRLMLTKVVPKITKKRGRS
ncbi:hypothetical protein Hanom_Chr06g00529421 [Helianthus anomalus]